MHCKRFWIMVDGKHPIGRLKACSRPKSRCRHRLQVVNNQSSWGSKSKSCRPLINYICISTDSTFLSVRYTLKASLPNIGRLETFYAFHQATMSPTKYRRSHGLKFCGTSSVGTGSGEKCFAYLLRATLNSARSANHRIPIQEFHQCLCLLT